MTKLDRRAALKAGAAAAATLAMPAIARAQQTTLKVVWMGWPDHQVLPLMAAFEKRNPSIKLAVERMPFSQIFQALEVRLNARGNDPDIYIVDSPLTASYASRGHLRPLDDIIDKKRFAPSAIAAASYQGKVYSAPFGSSMQVLYYNKTMLKAAGIAAPSADPAKRLTWEQVLDIARKIAKPAANIWGFSFEQQERPYQLLPLGQSLGGVALSPDGFKATGFLDGPAFVEAFTFMQKLYTEWKVSPPGQFDTALTPELFGNEKCALMLGGTFLFDTFKTKFPKLDFAVAPHPYFAKGKPVTPTGAWHFGINPRSTQQAAAAQFVKEMLSDDINVLWFKARPYVPTLNAVWAKEPVTFEADMWKIAQYELQNTALPRPATPGFREYEDILRVALRDIQGGGAVQGILTAAAQKIDREIAKYRG
ncbi:MAG: sugar ABC transporter substrate-binding protein [Hyphomicrobiaceae bacterium]|nr:MAG: sugar ABC transporter substrate-binding protein [Hyphomicrobiaceae bacterium]